MVRLRARAETATGDESRGGTEEYVSFAIALSVWSAVVGPERDVALACESKFVFGARDGFWTGWELGWKGEREYGGVFVHCDYYGCWFGECGGVVGDRGRV